MVSSSRWRRPPTSRRRPDATNQRPERIRPPFEGPPTVTNPSASIPLVSTIFGLTYLALALGKIPGLRIDRAGIALAGAALMLACGVMTLGDAAKAVDYETIILLFGMMVVVAFLRMAGFFAL